MHDFCVKKLGNSWLLTAFFALNPHIFPLFYLAPDSRKGLNVFLYELGWIRIGYATAASLSENHPAPDPAKPDSPRNWRRQF